MQRRRAESKSSTAEHICLVELLKQLEHIVSNDPNVGLLLVVRFAVDENEFHVHVEALPCGLRRSARLAVVAAF